MFCVSFLVSGLGSMIVVLLESSFLVVFVESFGTTASTKGSGITVSPVELIWVSCIAFASSSFLTSTGSGASTLVATAGAATTAVPVAIVLSVSFPALVPALSTIFLTKLLKKAFW